MPGTVKLGSACGHRRRVLPPYAARRRLTPRSSGAPTAGHQARSGGTRYIFASPGLASCRCRPLSSNVRPHKRTPQHVHRFCSAQHRWRAPPVELRRAATYALRWPRMARRGRKAPGSEPSHACSVQLAASALRFDRTSTAAHRKEIKLVSSSSRAARGTRLWPWQLHRAPRAQQPRRTPMQNLRACRAQATLNSAASQETPSK